MLAPGRAQGDLQERQVAWLVGDVALHRFHDRDLLPVRHHGDRPQELRRESGGGIGHIVLDHRLAGVARIERALNYLSETGATERA